mmetsp:Transcript_11093/g.31906  ORF Transcript_11093/g.31906 Transcript_11093/m.31906 type:complete len:320 (-) Transcript_11093:310-1269(-)
MRISSFSRRFSRSNNLQRSSLRRDSSSCRVNRNSSRRCASFRSRAYCFSWRRLALYSFAFATNLSLHSSYKSICPSKVLMCASRSATISCSSALDLLLLMRLAADDLPAPCPNISTKSAGISPRLLFGILAGEVLACLFLGGDRSWRSNFARWRQPQPNAAVFSVDLLEGQSEILEAPNSSVLASPADVVVSEEGTVRELRDVADVAAIHDPDRVVVRCFDDLRDGGFRLQQVFVVLPVQEGASTHPRTHVIRVDLPARFQPKRNVLLGRIERQRPVEVIDDDGQPLAKVRSAVSQVKSIPTRIDRLPNRRLARPPFLE